MRIAPALGFYCGLFALFWTVESFAELAGTASATPDNTPPAAASSKPSIMIAPQQTGLAGSCGGAGFDVNTAINVSSQASADVKLTAPDVGVVEEFTDETGKNIGPYKADFPSFHIPAFGGGLAPNTELTLTITTYDGPGLTGAITSVSKLTFNCTTGAVIPAVAGAPASIPVLPPLAVAALAALLAMLGAMRLRVPLRRRRHAAHR